MVEQTKKKQKTGGRTKGTPNKRQGFSVASLLADKNIDPIEEIMKLMLSGELRPNEQLRAWLELLQYCDAKRKAIEVDLPESDKTTDELLDGVDRAKIVAMAKGAA